MMFASRRQRNSTANINTEAQKAFVVCRLKLLPICRLRTTTAEEGGGG